MMGARSEKEENILTDGRHLTTAERIIVIAADNQVNESRRNTRFRLIGLPGDNHSRPHRRLGFQYGFWRLCPRPCSAREICAQLFCAPKS